MEARTHPGAGGCGRRRARYLHYRLHIGTTSFLHLTMCTIACAQCGLECDFEALLRMAAQRRLRELGEVGSSHREGSGAAGPTPTPAMSAVPPGHRSLATALAG